MNLALARLEALVPSFRGSTTFELLLPCTYDLEVAATKYLYALVDGVAPLAFHFSGTVFHARRRRAHGARAGAVERDGPLRPAGRDVARA